MTNSSDEAENVADPTAVGPGGAPLRTPVDVRTTAWQLVQAQPLVAAGAVTFAATLGLTRGLTAPPQVMLAIFGWLMCGWLAWRPMERRAAPDRLSAVGVAPWIMVMLAIAGIELYSFYHGSTYQHPTLSSLTDPAFDTFGVRVAFVLGWLAAGWHLVRR